MAPERKIPLKIDTQARRSHRISKPEQRRVTSISRMSSYQARMYDLSLFDITQACATKQGTSTHDNTGTEASESEQTRTPEPQPSLHHHQRSRHHPTSSSSYTKSSSSLHSRSTSQAEAINELLKRIRDHRASASIRSQSDATRSIHPHRYPKPTAQDMHHSLQQNHGNANLRHS
ncbi:hypothetical protein MVEG_09124 [Podila verticillata NRRL 6337]|nr:MAG: hypothetical protein BYD32DRAFT_402582 [Podila humilis]KFH65650.1 hypothetical protein MVEG_09124 [Podila verticillata NRRL 6337]